MRGRSNRYELVEGPVFESVKVAAISMKPKAWDKAGNADKLEALYVEAAREKPRLIVAPEGALDGYAVTDVIENPERTDEMVDHVAEPLDGPYIERFRRLARFLGSSLCFGFAERISRDSYNCAIVIDHEGEICGRYHKTQFAEGYDASWSFNRIGRSLRAFDTPFGRTGIVICNDRWNPAIARALALDGARIILIPSWGSRNRAQNLAVLARARENGLPVVEANVGMNLIISTGEIVAYKHGFDKITTAVVEVPAGPSPENARQAEQEYLAAQGPEMARRYEKLMKRLAAGGHVG